MHWLKNEAVFMALVGIPGVAAFATDGLPALVGYTISMACLLGVLAARKGLMRRSR